MKYQGFKPCGKSAWVNERRQTVCQSDPCKKYLCFLIYLHASQCVCVFMGEGSKWGFDLIKDEKIYSSVHIDILVRILMWFSMWRASSCLWSQKKIDWYFRTYALFSRMYRLSCHKPKVPEFESFIYHWRSTRTFQFNNMTIHCHRLSDQCPETMTSVEVDLIFSPVPSDTPNPSQSHGQWGSDPFSPCWLKRMQLCSRGQAELPLIPLYTPLRIEGWRSKACSITPDEDQPC